MLDAAAAQHHREVERLGVGLAGICKQLKAWTRPSGYVLVGEGYWRAKPHAEYLALLGGSESEFLDHRGNVQAGIDAGLVPMHATLLIPPSLEFSDREETENSRLTRDPSLRRHVDDYSCLGLRAASASGGGGQWPAEVRCCGYVHLGSAGDC